MSKKAKTIGTVIGVCRRTELLAILVALFLTLAGSACAQTRGDHGEGAALSMKLGAEEHIPFGDIRFCPDEHVSYRKGPHGFSVWVAGEGGNWLFDGPALAELARFGKGPVLPSRGNQHFDRDYIGLSAVIPCELEHRAPPLAHGVQEQRRQSAPRRPRTESTSARGSRSCVFRLSTESRETSSRRTRRS